MKFNNKKAEEQFCRLHKIICKKRIEEFNKSNKKVITDSLDEETKDLYRAYNEAHIDFIKRYSYDEACSLYGTEEGNIILNNG